MRIVSLEPGCTEWVAAFGAREYLVARSDVCDYPPSVKDLPVAIKYSITDTTSQGIYAESMSRVERGHGVFYIDTKLIRSLQPDLILTNGEPHIRRELSVDSGGEITTLSGECTKTFEMRPTTFKQVLNDALRLGSMIGRSREAMTCVAMLERRLGTLQTRLGIRKATRSDDLPSVLSLGEINPIIAHGYWLPDMVALAGGLPVVQEAGNPSRRIDWEAVLHEDPDVLAIIVSGFDLKRSRGELAALAQRPEWHDLKAVRTGRVFIFDGGGCFSRPGPRLYRGIELLACALHQKTGFEPEEWEMENVRTAWKPGS